MKKGLQLHAKEKAEKAAKLTEGADIKGEDEQNLTKPIIEET